VADLRQNPAVSFDMICQQYLPFIADRVIYLSQIFKLFEYTSYLNSVSISFDSHDTNEDYKPSYFFMLTNLSIYVYRLSDTSKMIFFLQNVPNLHRLDVHLSFNIINGYQWEQLIQNYLPKMKVFTLMMKNVYPADRNIQEKADELIHSFRSSFWIDEHKWFVRCAAYDKTIQLQTLSNIYFTFEKKLSCFVEIDISIR